MQITGLSRELLVGVGVLGVVGLFLSCKLPNKILTGQSLVFLAFSLNPFSLFSGLLRLLIRALLRVSEADEDSSKTFCFPDISRQHELTL